jgi:hypothetical protein
LRAPSPGRGGHSRPVHQGGRGRPAAQGLALLQVPTRGEAHEVSQGESDRGSEDDESLVLLPPPPFDDEELERTIDDTFEETTSGSLAHLQGDFDLESFNEQSNEMFTGLSSMVNRLLGNEGQQDSIETIMGKMVQAHSYSQSDSPVIASAGRVWLSRLTTQLNAQHGFQVDGSSSAVEANP